MGLNYNPASVTQGLVYYLDLTNSRCYSGSGNTLTNLANGAIGITIVSGITYDTDYRKNLNFNGSSGYMTGNDTSLDFSTSDFTIQTTFKLNGLSNGFSSAYGSVICAGSALTNNSSILQFSGTATSHYGIALWHQPTTTLIGRNYNFQTNKIYNLAVTKRYNVIEFFVDGSSIGTTTSSNNFNFTANGFAIGRWYYPGYEQYLKGNIYDFRAYNRALSPEELQQNYFSQTKRYYNEENIVTNGLVFNIDASKSNSYAGVGNTIYDISGSGKIGTLNNGPTFSGLNGGSIAFDGSNDYILFPTSGLPYGASARTISIWINPSSLSNGWAISYGNATATQSNFIGVYSGVINYGGYSNDVSGPAPVINTWYNIVGVYDGTIAYMYINGYLYTSLARTWNTVQASFQIGRQTNGGEYFNGKVAEAQIYNRVLSAQEISQNFNALRSRFGI